MGSEEVRKLIKYESLDDFEFIDAEEDLHIDLQNSPTHGVVQKFGSGLGLVVSSLCTAVEEQGMSISLPVKTIATTAAVGALAGSLLGGPSGLAVGLVTGVVVACSNSPARPKKQIPQQSKTSIRQIFNQMTLQQKKELLKELLGCLKQSNVRCLVLEILKNEGIRNMALEILSSFLMKRIGVSLVRQK